MDNSTKDLIKGNPSPPPAYGHLYMDNSMKDLIKETPSPPPAYG